MKNIILVFLLLLYVMMSCDNAAVDKKTSGSDTTLCISYNVYYSPRYYSFHLQSGNELSEYLVKAKSAYADEDIVKIEEGINYVVHHPVDYNDTTVAFIGDYKQKYFKTSYEQNFMMMSNALDSLPLEVGISDTCKIYLDLSFGGTATVEMTVEYIRRRQSLSRNIDKGCFSDIVKSSRMVNNWNSILRPYNVYVADVAVSDVEIISLKRFMKRNVGLKSFVSPPNNYYKQESVSFTQTYRIDIGQRSVCYKHFISQGGKLALVVVYA